LKNRTFRYPQLRGKILDSRGMISVLGKMLHRGVHDPRALCLRARRSSARPIQNR
jgi:hypothetical protein